MIFRLAGLAVTTLAVLALIGSLVAGLSGPPDPEVWSAATVAPSPAATRERIRVEVLNGGDVAGLARRVTERLRAGGFDVVYYGNAGPLGRDSTIVLDRGGNAVTARSVADALGIGRVESAVDTSLYLEATVILGSDWPDIGEAP